MSADRYLPETMGPGVAFFDYDNDGWLDLFMVNSGGPVDFYTPKRRSRTRSTRTIETARSRTSLTRLVSRAGNSSGWAAPWATTTTTATPISS